MKVLKNCRFIPELVEGYEGTSGDILVEDGRILEVTEGKDAYPEDAEVYDMGGKYALRDSLTCIFTFPCLAETL